MKKLLIGSLILLAITPAAFAQQGKGRKVKIKDLFAFKRLNDPQISPDGKWVAYVQTTVNLKKNKSSSNIWLVATKGGDPRPLTKGAKNNSHPRWSPDGKQILFSSNRSGSEQLWIMDADKGKPRQLTDIATGAEEAIWSADGKHIAFVSSVWPEYAKKPYKESNALNKKRMDQMKKNPVKARVFTRLFFRHWNHYLHNKRRHIFVIAAKGGEPRDVTPENRDADPLSFTFSGGEDFTFSPDGRHILFTAAPQKGEAWKTNYDICVVSISGGKIHTLMKNPAADNAPRFSPDGKWLAWRAQSKPGYEADRWQLYVAPVSGDAYFPDMSQKKSLTADFDGSVEQFAWKSDNKTITFLTEKNGRVTDANVDRLRGHVKLGGGLGLNLNLRSFSMTKNSNLLAVAYDSMSMPAEILVKQNSTDANTVMFITKANDKLLSQITLPHPESVTVKGAGGTPMQMWILKPPGFDPKKKWPLIYMVHGGPQGAWIDGWHYRWNPQIWAAQGYVVALPNPRGSTGFGQKYVEEISRDWGGKPFDDLMAGVAYLEKQPYIDSKRMVAAGASYGGYMMNWFQGHTDKFKTLVCHAGVYNLESMYGTTEELWFVEWDVGGKPWTNREAYRKFSPHLFAKNFKTPMLIIHGELDFRVPVSEGLQMFTTLQRQGIPSKMIVFPGEGHFVSKPRNSQFWHQQIFAWLRKYAPPGGRKRE